MTTTGKPCLGPFTLIIKYWFCLLDQFLALWQGRDKKTPARGVSDEQEMGLESRNSSRDGREIEDPKC